MHLTRVQTSNFQTGTRDPRDVSTIMASFRGTISKHDHNSSDPS
uniref:UORF n=1 Tax=Epichloe festucae TaxID=35717 RepID=C0L6J3_9HYPO|nr:uORF [Epichloe festucae]